MTSITRVRTALISGALLAGLLACTACGSSEPASHQPAAPGVEQSAPSGVAKLPTTPVPAPAGGNVHRTVAAQPISTRPPVAFSHPAQFGDGVTAIITGQRIVHVKAKLPGEIAGAAVAVTVRLVNRSAQPVSLDAVVVNDQDRAGTPLVQITSASTPLRGELAAHYAKSGSYVFGLPAHYRNPLTLTVRYSTAAPVVAFVGPVR
ncbi:MAG TPA: hypothetical protein VE442_04385 [Jatrophihabitans sp.]|jgi:hypothetical protein|nr:hypothetical protein [Jatrophihabitans sp.]